MGFGTLGFPDSITPVVTAIIYEAGTGISDSGPGSTLLCPTMSSAPPCASCLPYTDCEASSVRDTCRFLAKCLVHQLQSHCSEVCVQGHSERTSESRVSVWKESVESILSEVAADMFLMETQISLRSEITQRCLANANTNTSFSPIQDTFTSAEDTHHRHDNNSPAS
ncbi:hypothetical protein WMY93_016607 [Mugilogobius chulae]|uniref:Uncharacterized protein n=1 Tax=Mugilogobius chulae TaxID=88201 RepID=A0AAW0NW12_9GOBI